MREVSYRFLSIILREGGLFLGLGFVWNGKAIVSDLAR
jgi:hypothetical protein